MLQDPHYHDPLILKLTMSFSFLTLRTEQFVAKAPKNSNFISIDTEAIECSIWGQ